MAEHAPDPLVPPDVDIRGFSGFMLDVDRLLASELVALGTADECWHAVMLWCRAWQQSPPGSLPNDDRVLAAFSKAGPRWRKVKDMALRGFVLCSDGRLYHRVLCEQVMSAWAKRKAYRSDQERLRKWRDGKRSNPHETPTETPVETPVETHFSGVSSPVSSGVSEPDRQGQGQGQGQGKESSELRSAQAVADRLFTEGIAIVGELTGKSRDAAAKLIGNWRKSAKNDDTLLETILAAAKERPVHAVSWIAAGLKARAGPNGANGKHDPTNGAAPTEDDPHGIAAWIARQNTEPGTDQDTGQQVPCINGYVLEDACETTLEAIAQGGGSFADRVNFDAMAGWCRDDVIASQAFMPTIRRVSRALPDPVRSLAVFDAAVREAAARSAA